VSPSAEQIDALLPQTQCQRCGYEGCLPYARAVASGEALINRCPPGGRQTIDRLADLTGQPALPLAADCGDEPGRRVAYIREDECIGCTKCIQACPVDAIVGAAKLMHTVISAECTGCDLCVPACPVDCIDMPGAARDEGQPAWPPARPVDAERAERARGRFHDRNHRLDALRARRAQAREQRKQARTQARGDPTHGRRAEIQAAIARAKARRAAKQANEP
jgi:electron transport complex protein RnfB